MHCSLSAPYACFQLPHHLRYYLHVKRVLHRAAQFVGFRDIDFNTVTITVAYSELTLVKCTEICSEKQSANQNDSVDPA